MTASPPIRIGTRASPLARWQAQWVADGLAARGQAAELVPITTAGDVDRERPIGQVGTVGVFTKELQRALLDGRIDVAVHSLKDLPTDEVAGLVIAAVPPRESPRDALVSHDGRPLKSLPPGATIGTGSLRRQSQLLHARGDLRIVSIRGNVETRLQKLAAGGCDALVLAEAGLRRLGLAGHITEILKPPRFLPAVGQGALAVECLTDAEVRLALKPLDDPATRAAVEAERSMLAELAGGCLAPIGAWGRVDDTGRLRLDGAVLSSDGRQRLDASASGELSRAVDLGRQVAEQLLAQGAAELIRQSRERP